MQQDIFINAQNPFIGHSTSHLLAIRGHLEVQLSIINGTYVPKPNRQGKMIKPITCTHMRPTWMRSLSLIDQVLRKRDQLKHL